MLGVDTGIDVGYDLFYMYLYILYIYIVHLGKWVCIYFSPTNHFHDLFNETSLVVHILRRHQKKASSMQGGEFPVPKKNMQVAVLCLMFILISRSTSPEN